jgi:hypothetical protein
MSGGRLVFVAGNHDHHFVHRDAEARLEARLAAGLSPREGDSASGDGPGADPPGPEFLRSFLTQRLPGVEVEIAYPTHTFAGVLCTHGHYLDPHARLTGSRGDRLLTRTLWAIATGGPEEPKTAADYESVITLLTEWLYIAAQMPHGTHAQQNVYRAIRRAATVGNVAGLPVRGAKRLTARLRDAGGGEEALPSEEHFDSVVREEAERQRREEPAPGAAFPRPAYPAASVVSPSDPTEHALEAFARVVENLGWNRETDRIVFAHTHQPLADVRSSRDSRTRYWNTGCWIYEPDLSSRQAYARYLRHGWPGTAVVIDDEEPEPRLVELLADLNPLSDDGKPA